MPLWSQISDGLEQANSGENNERGTGDEVHTRAFESLVDVFDTGVCEGQTIANERCCFFWECLKEGFLGRHDG